MALVSHLRFTSLSFLLSRMGMEEEFTLVDSLRVLPIMGGGGHGDRNVRQLQPGSREMGGRAYVFFIFLF